MGQLAKFRAFCWKNTRLAVHSCFLISCAVFFLVIFVGSVPLISSTRNKRKNIGDSEIYSVDVQSLAYSKLVYNSTGTRTFQFPMMSCMKTNSKGGEKVVINASTWHFLGNYSDPLSHLSSVFTRDSSQEMSYELQASSGSGWDDAPFPVTGLWVERLDHFPDSRSTLNPASKATPYYMKDPKDPRQYKHSYDAFVYGEYTLDGCILTVRAQANLNPKLVLKRLPTRALYRFYEMESLIGLIPVLLLLGSVFLFAWIPYMASQEKDDGMWFLYRLWGATSTNYWLSWLLFAFVVAVAACTGCTLLLFSVLECNALFLWILLWEFYMATYCMLFVVCLFSNHATTTVFAALFLTFVSGAIATEFMENTHLPLYAKYVLCVVLPPISGPMAIHTLRYKATHTEDTSIFIPNGNIMPEAVLALGLVGSMVFYIGILLCTAHFTFGRIGQSSACKKLNDDPQSKESSSEAKFVERPDSKDRPFIETANLTKTFKEGSNSVCAVTNLSMTIYEDYNTVILGRNCCGKTTLIHLICATLLPTSGDVYMRGEKMDARHGVEDISLCTENNRFLVNLTTEENILFAAKMKQSDGEEELAAEEMMKDMHLARVERTYPPLLTPGDTRRLCLGMALIGTSKCIVIDEPSRDLDPIEKEEIWKCILRCCSSRTLVVATNSSEEADVLGEKIAIISDGKLISYGSPNYLKKTTDRVYNLKIKKVGKVCENVENLRFLSKAEKIEGSNNVVTYTFPAQENECLGILFSVLDGNRQKLGVGNMALSLSNCDGSYLKSSTDDVGEIAKFLYEGAEHTPNAKEGGPQAIAHKPRMTPGVFPEKLLILLWKNALFTRRTLWCFVLAIIFMLACFWIGIYLYKLDMHPTDLPEREMNLSQYGQTVVMYYDEGDNPELIEYLNYTVRAENSCLVKTRDESTLLSLLKKIEKKGTATIRKYVVAFGIRSENEVNVYYSPWAIHSAPIATNLVFNMMYKHKMGNENYTIKTVLRSPDNPVRPPLNTLVRWWSLMFYGWSLWYCMLAWLHVEENAHKVKHLQFMAGASQELFWFANFLWCILLHLVACLIMTSFAAAIFSFELPGCINETELGFLFMIWFFSGMCGIPFVFMISFFVANISCVFIIVNIFEILSVIISTFPLLACDCQFTKSLKNTIFAAYSLIPQQNNYVLVETFLKNFAKNKECYSIMYHYDRNMLCDISRPSFQLHRCCDCVGPKCETTKYFTNDALKYVFVLCLGSVLFATLVLVLEYGYFDEMCDRILAGVLHFSSEKRSSLSRTAQQPDNVAGSTRENEPDLLEREQDQQLEAPDPRQLQLPTPADVALLAHSLEKRFDPSRGVRDVCFTVGRGQCFGLLGHRRAGKSTIMNMLAGVFYPSSGNVHSGRQALVADRMKFGRLSAYCPQRDALIGRFTAREMVHLVTHLHRVEDMAREEATLKAMEIKDLMSRCHTYNASDRRKLNMALAILSDPHVLLLDEPMRGVDECSRRRLWRVLEHQCLTGRTVVVASHGVQECADASDRVALLSAGRVLREGPRHRLTTQLSRTFRLRLGLRSIVLIPSVMKDVPRALPGARLLFKTNLNLVYQLERCYLSWGQLYEDVESLRSRHMTIDNYTISEVTVSEAMRDGARKK